MSSSPNGFRRIVLREMEERIATVLSKLEESNPKQAEAFRLCEIQGWTYQDVAAHQRCKPGTAKVRVYRARRFLRRYLGDVRPDV